MSEKGLSGIFSGGNSDLQAAVSKVKAAISAGKAEYIQLNAREQTLTSERDGLPKKSIPHKALCDEITQHARAAIDEATDTLGHFIAEHIALFATQRTLNLSGADRLQEGTAITYARFDDALARSKGRPHLLPGVIAQSSPIDPLIMATILLGKLKNKTPAAVFGDVLKSLPSSALGYDQCEPSCIGIDRTAMVARVAEIDAELASIRQRREDLRAELKVMGVDTSKAGWMYEKDAQ